MYGGSYIAKLLLLMCCAILLSASTGRYSDTKDSAITVSKELRYYDIDGATAEELRQQMMAHGPKDSAGHAHFAEAAWDIGWQHDAQDPRLMRIRVRLQVTLPRWKGKDSASPTLRGEWEELMLRMAEHEARHMEHVSQNLASLMDALNRAAAFPDSTEREINLAGHSVLRKIRELDQRYDYETKHGASEGIWATNVM